MEGKVLDLKVHNKNCLGCEKNKANIMLTIRLEDTQFNDFFLNTTQAENLIEQLKQQLNYNKPLVQRAEEYARKCHEGTNHKYDGLPYVDTHIVKVVEVAKTFKMLLNDYDVEDVFSAAWTHDTIEDTRQTPNDVQKALGSTVAKIVFALSNEKGWNRAERANDKYYEGIKQTPNATFVKLCDRIANIEYSKSKQSSMFEAYKKEHEHFKQQLYVQGQLEPMWNYLENLFK